MQIRNKNLELCKVDVGLKRILAEKLKVCNNGFASISINFLASEKSRNYIGKYFYKQALI